MTRIIVVGFDGYYVDFHIDPDFFAHYGQDAWGYYAAAEDRRKSGHFATIYLPQRASLPNGIGTLAHEVTRLVDDWLQHENGTAGLLRTELRAVKIGEIVTSFLEKVV